MLWKAIVDKIQTFVHNINIDIGISVYVQFLISAVSMSCNFTHLQFYSIGILASYNF